jgi:transcriptional regulator with XRE-family HTH domain
LEDFFSRLKAEREERGISLEKMFEKTRISVNFLQAIERGDLKSLPKGYDRIFMKTYLTSLDLDVAHHLAEFDRLLGRREPTQIIDLEELERSRQEEQTASKNKYKHLILWLPLIVLLSVLLFLFAEYGIVGTGDEVADTGTVPELKLEDYIDEIDTSQTAIMIPKTKNDTLIATIRGLRKTWVRTVVDRADTSIYTLQTGQERTFGADSLLIFTLGIANGVRISANDTTYENFGTSSQVVRRLELTPDGIRRTYLQKSKLTCSERMKITLFILLVFSCNGLSAGKYSQGRMGAISCDDSLAADAGKQMILAGGNAVDAAVAAAFALAVTYPNAGNIGGGGFALIHLPNGEVHALDFRETAPRAAFATMYLDSAGNIDTDLSRSGPLSAGVPGTVRGLWEMHRKFGRLPWKQCLAPAILLAKNGFVLPPYMAALLTRFDANFRLFPATSDIFCRPDSQFTAGDTLYQEDLALVLQSLASEGPDVFYKGWIAQRIVKSMQASKGLISLEDLASYTAEWRQTVQFELNGYQIKTMGLPSSAGITMQQMLRLYERYFRENPTYAGSASLLHQMIEVNKRVLRIAIPIWPIPLFCRMIFRI